MGSCSLFCGITKKLNSSTALRIQSLFLLLIFLATTSTDSLAQLNAGVFFSRLQSVLKGDSRTETFGVAIGHHDSYAAGLIVEAPLTDDVYISFQPSYKIHRMYLLEEGPDIAPFSGDTLLRNVWIKQADFDMHDLSLPLYMKIISDNTRWQFVAGIETNVRLGGLIKFTDQRPNEKTKDEVGSISFAAQVGFGYRFRLLKNTFAVDAMYTQGLSNISTKRAVDPFFPARIKLNSTELRLTWFLPLKNSRIIEDE